MQSFLCLQIFSINRNILPYWYSLFIPDNMIIQDMNSSRWIIFKSSSEILKNGIWSRISLVIWEQNLMHEFSPKGIINQLMNWIGESPDSFSNDELFSCQYHFQYYSLPNYFVLYLEEYCFFCHLLVVAMFYWWNKPSVLLP